jgi:transcriptional regulator with XRE-family HTH domain
VVGTQTSISDLVQHGRRIGLLPQPEPEGPVAVIAGFQAPSDSVALLGGGNDSAAANWGHTPIVMPRAGQDPQAFFSLTTPTTTDVPSLRIIDMVVPGRGSVITTQLEGSTSLLVDAVVLNRQPWMAHSAWQPGFFSLVSQIRESAGLTIDELAQILGRSRKQYYNWQTKGAAPREIHDRAKVIAEALRPAPQPAPRIKEWLLSTSTRGLLAEPDLTRFVDEAESWVLSAATPKKARRLGVDEMMAMGGAEPSLDEDELAAFFARPAHVDSGVLPHNPNYYRDLSGSPDDDE